MKIVVRHLMPGIVPETLVALGQHDARMYAAGERLKKDRIPETQDLLEVLALQIDNQCKWLKQLSRRAGFLANAGGRRESVFELLHRILPSAHETFEISRRVGRRRRAGHDVLRDTNERDDQRLLNVIIFSGIEKLKANLRREAHWFRSTRPQSSRRSMSHLYLPSYVLSVLHRVSVPSFDKDATHLCQKISPARRPPYFNVIVVRASV